MNFCFSRFLVRSLVLPAALFALFVATTGCSRVHYKIVPFGDTGFHATQRPAEREIPMYSSKAPVDGLEIAALLSRRVKEKNEENLQLQVEDIRLAAVAINADAVVDLRMEPVRRQGWTGDPNTPFPSWKHGGWLEYELHGTAVIFPDHERQLRADAHNEADAVEADAEEFVVAEEATEEAAEEIDE